MVNYKVVVRDGSFYPIRTLKEVQRLVLDMSFQKRDVFGHICEREDDGTLGTPWTDSISLNFKVAVNNGHISMIADYIYCIDGKLIAGYAAAVAYIVSLGFSKADASDLVINL